MKSSQRTTISYPLFEISPACCGVDPVPTVIGGVTFNITLDVFLSYQSNDPDNLLANALKSNPTEVSSVISQPKVGSIKDPIVVPEYNEPPKS